MNCKAKKSIPAETVGRKYEVLRWGFLSRRAGTETWYGHTNHKTEQEAMEAFDRSLKHQRYQHLAGGLTVDFGPDTGERYERKVVKIVSQCEVIAVGVGPA